MKCFLAYKSNGLEECIRKLAYSIDHVSLNGSRGNFSAFIESARLKKSDWLFLDEKGKNDRTGFNHIDRMDDFVPTFDNMISYLFLAMVCDDNYLQLVLISR